MDLNVKLQGLKYNYEKLHGCFCKILRFQWFSGFMELFSLRKICRICPRGCGPGPPALAHGSTDFIKRQPLASRSMAQIEPSEPVSRPFITDPTVEAAGSGRGRRGITLAAARHGRARRLTGVRVFLSYGGRFPMRFAPTGSQRRGELNYANLNRRRATTVRWLGRWLATVRAASGEASTLRTCAEAFSNSLLASRPINCSERWWKTRIWWLPRVRWVVNLRPKIRTIGDTIYRGF
jgi:hypothetical protein